MRLSLPLVSIGYTLMTHWKRGAFLFHMDLFPHSETLQYSDIPY